MSRSPLSRVLALRARTHASGFAEDPKVRPWWEDLPNGDAEVGLRRARVTPARDAGRLP